MIDEEGLSPAEVDQIIHRHNMGDTSATATLSDSVSHYAEVHGKELAGIVATPDPNAVSSANETRSQEIMDQQSKITDSGNRNSQETQQAARSAGIPHEWSINNSVAVLMDESGLEMDGATQKIDVGRASLSAESRQLEGAVTDKQQVYSAGSAPSIHETMDKVKTKLTNKFSDFFD